MSQDFADIPLPKAWPERARAAIVHVIALAEQLQGVPICIQGGVCSITSKNPT